MDYVIVECSLISMINSTNVVQTKSCDPANDLPIVTIMEQPGKGYKLRYGAEKVVTPLYAEQSTKQKKVFTKIRISELGRTHWRNLKVFVSCVTHNETFPRAHPNLIMNNKRNKGDNCQDGVCFKSLSIQQDQKEEVLEFKDIGIQRVKMSEIPSCLEKREALGIFDLLSKGHTNEKFNMESVKLCFQVVLTNTDGKSVFLAPVISQTISHTKSQEMSINMLAPDAVECDQPTKMIILGDNFPRRDDIRVKFFTSSWSKTVSPAYLHHDCGVQVWIPGLDFDINEETKVQVKLVRISNEAETEALDFFYLPHKTITQRSTQTQDSLTDEWSNFRADEYQLPWSDLGDLGNQL